MAKRTKTKVKLQEFPRNRITLLAITLKGGAHRKSDKAERRADHQRTQHAAREAFADRAGGFFWPQPLCAGFFRLG